MSGTPEGKLLWEPSREQVERSEIARYMRWLREERGVEARSYEELWRWSVGEVEDFWASVWDYCGVSEYAPYGRVLAERRMPGARWFEGTRLNYARRIFENYRGEAPALIYASERRGLSEVSWSELKEKTAALAAALRGMGVRPGDRVAAYVPNSPEAIVAFLACASVGAVWSSCSPDFGTRGVADRFEQIEPKVLFAVDGYVYGGRPYDRLSTVAQLQREMPSLERTVLIPYLSDTPDTGVLRDAFLWDDLLTGAGGELEFEPVPFDHPLWILYSSGTTGLPKAIVQGHGGIMLEHLKLLRLHHDLGPDDRLFWFTTTGWMMWNVVVSGLLTGAASVLYDGSPGYPDMNVLWRFAQEAGITLFGTSAGYIGACAKAGVEPGRDHDLSRLRSIGSTGSPLPPEGFAWVYEHVKQDLWLASVSGGTDLCTAFVGGCPLLPVHAGELQCRCLGAKVEAFSERGEPLTDEVGELVITEPMPSMPLYFWNDPGGERYRESYFDTFPGVWRHGDWIKIKPRGSCVIYGRSDSTINRGGVRMGTSEIYAAVESLPEIADSLVVDTEALGGRSYMPLFVVLNEGEELTEELKQRIKSRIRQDISPRHVPDEIFAVQEIPRTLNGKKLEVPVKKILMGSPPERSLNPGSVANPKAVEFFVRLARKLQKEEV
ncbi:acetoacetate--CoA ligase [Rubrobacter taiwanensis]|jgi:acetoacetyl-CoA synthetase|uniref:Acetoacetate--CoA ligase n=1 Tax=Rubrobacter taiwanensis TaxID=185139 RepID=A0A4R1BRB2_9ACTN|nr:acetoacetate--CoA ligase [Rubrobacter taiwanensis]TCJ19725.1 acetoacetate--CoA ligase [Rubrobacter taiwanensis]